MTGREVEIGTVLDLLDVGILDMRMVERCVSPPCRRDDRDLRFDDDVWNWKGGGPLSVGRKVDPVRGYTLTVPLRLVPDVVLYSNRRSSPRTPPHSAFPSSRPHHSPPTPLLHPTRRPPLLSIPASHSHTARGGTAACVGCGRHFVRIVWCRIRRDRVGFRYL